MASKDQTIGIPMTENGNLTTTEPEKCHCTEIASAARARQLAAEIHQLDSGRWVIASWSADHAQWQGIARPSVRRTQTGYCYSFARTLEGLAGVLTSYATRAGAVRACEPSTAVRTAECDLCYHTRAGAQEPSQRFLVQL